MDIKGIKKHMAIRWQMQGEWMLVNVKGIENGDLDVVTAYTVDPQILEYDLEILEDDQKFFLQTTAPEVARNAVIVEYPEVAEVLDSIVGSISTEEMTEMIREVDINERSTEEVAQEFLQEKGLLD